MSEKLGSSMLIEKKKVSKTHPCLHQGSWDGAGKQVYILGIITDPNMVRAQHHSSTVTDNWQTLGLGPDFLQCGRIFSLLNHFFFQLDTKLSFVWYSVVSSLVQALLISVRIFYPALLCDAVLFG